MKKRIALFLTFLLCLSLVACKNNPVGGTTAGTGNSTTAPGTPTNGIQTGTVDVQTLRTGTWHSHKRVESSQSFTYGEGGYYYFPNGEASLHFFDLASGIDVVLCQKVGCLHENEKYYKDKLSCEAFLGVDTIFFYDSGYLYYAKTDSHGQHLYRRNADCTGEKYIATLWQDYAGSKYEIQVMNYLFSDCVLYYTISASTVTPDQDGVLIQETSYYALLRLDFSTGKEEEVMRGTNIGINLIAAKKDAILYSTKDAGYYKLPSSDRLEGMFNTPVYTYLWTKEDGVSQELLCKPYRENLGIDSFDNGVITSSNYDTGVPYTYDLVTGEYRELPVPPSGEKLNEQLYILDDQMTIYNVQTGKNLLNEFVDQCPSEFDKISFAFFASSNDGILMRRYYLVKDSDGFAAKECHISYVSFDSLADGLHIQDAIEIMSEKYGD